MREIKFRAWDAEREEMFPVTNILFGVEPLVNRGDKSHGYRLMQYTGLRDKHGVEIYEGDIVKAFDERCEPWTSHRGVVAFDDGAFRIKKQNGFSPQVEESLMVDGEVIGNIYENPELLDKAA